MFQSLLDLVLWKLDQIPALRHGQVYISILNGNLSQLQDAFVALLQKYPRYDQGADFGENKAAATLV